MNEKMPAILTVRERRVITDKWLADRLENILPRVMEITGFDMWIIMTDECNEDPLTKTLLPAKMLSASRNMVLVFGLNADKTVSCETVSRPSGIEGIYSNSWYGISSPDWKGKAPAAPKKTQLEYLREYVERRNPKRIAVNVDDTRPLCDGLTHSNYMKLSTALGEKFTSRLAPSGELAVMWMETRSPGELAAYEGIVRLAHSIVAETFSAERIEPGITSNEDLRFHMMQRAQDLGMRCWFDCTVAVFRKNLSGMRNEPTVIMPGDVLHCDFGIEYLGLCTDCQKLCYVLRPGETDAPDGLKQAMAAANKLQNIVVSKIQVGKTGNQVLKESRSEALERGIEPCIYTHPIGFFGHGPGPIVGLFTNQNGDERGDACFHDNTLYALELNAKVPIPEWDGEMLMCCLETEIMLTCEKIRYVAERQTEYYLV